MPLPACFLCLLLSLLASAVQAQDHKLVLQAPLTTIWHSQRDAGMQFPAGGCVLELTVTVPDKAPADLGVGAWCSDQHGRWFQNLRSGILQPGTHHLRFDLRSSAALTCEPDPVAWTPAIAKRVDRGGLLFWSASASRSTLTISNIRFHETSEQDERQVAKPAIRDLLLPGLTDGSITAPCGQLWELHCRPDPWPKRQYESAHFSLDLHITEPNGKDFILPGFFMQPMHLSDAGYTETATANQLGSFRVRFRPRFPGKHSLKLVARWNQDQELQLPLPDLIATGPAWDDMVRVDPIDRRFFATQVLAGQPQLYWPIGLNIRSVWDVRSHTNKNFTTRLTPDRGSHAYREFFKRLATAGGNAVEVWLASWNLALEWRADWYGYHGLGDYNQGNAARLDQVLDDAWAEGMRINVVVRNHGMVSRKADRQWPDNPYNHALGGPAVDAVDFFTDETAAKWQADYRRYLIARYAHHPAVLGWKLFSEVNLTAARGEVCKNWFQKSAADWHAKDPYRHPVALHWSGDYRTPDRSIVAVPEMDYICIDAYHGRRRRGGRSMLPGIIADGMWHPTRNLSQFNKPLLVTEFGGSARACPEPQLLAEHSSACWTAMVSGNAGAPMLWWWEWVDQNDHWGPYTAISRFLIGEDLRSSKDVQAKGVRLHTQSTGANSSRSTYAGAWYRQGRLLGYVLDRTWGTEGGERPAMQASITIGAKVKAGEMRLEWWNADTGQRLEDHPFSHPGGALIIHTPPFAGHLAFKLQRTDEDI